jgi:hypothetical protein
LVFFIRIINGLHHTMLCSPECQAIASGNPALTSHPKNTIQRAPGSDFGGCARESAADFCPPDWPGTSTNTSWGRPSYFAHAPSALPSSDSIFKDQKNPKDVTRLYPLLSALIRPIRAFQPLFLPLG